MAYAITSPAKAAARPFWRWPVFRVLGISSGRDAVQAFPSKLRGTFIPARSYIDSIDRRTAVRSMSNPEDVLKYCEENRDLDASSLEASLRVLGRLATGANYSSIVQDHRFHELLASLAARLEDCDARIVSMIADACGRFRTSTPELSDFAQRLSDVVVRRENAFNPRSLTAIALGLSVRGVRDPNLINFVREESMKLMQDFDPNYIAPLLDAFRRWGIFDRQLVDMAVERMSDEVDRFTSIDVVDTFAVMSKLGLARGFLLRRLSSLAFENLQQFTPKQLVAVLYSLSRLRFITTGNVEDVLDVLSRDIPKLRNTQLAELLFSIAMTETRVDSGLISELVTRFVEGSPPKTTTSYIDVLWALCALDEVSVHEDAFRTCLADVFERNIPQNRTPLLKLFDIFCAVELEHKALGLEIPASWKTAANDADVMEMDRLESSRLHAEIVLRLDHLRGIARGLQWQLRVQRNQQCGPYRVDMLDLDTKVVIDVEVLNRPTSKAMKHRHLLDLGYKPLRLDYWDWRKSRSEEDQNTFLQREIIRVLESSPNE